MPTSTWNKLAAAHSISNATNINAYIQETYTRLRAKGISKHGAKLEIARQLETMKARANSALYAY